MMSTGTDAHRSARDQFLVLRGHPDRGTALAIIRHVREHLPGYLRIRRPEFAELLKTISGKICRVGSRTREQGAVAAGTTLREWWEEDFPESRGGVG